MNSHSQETLRRVEENDATLNEVQLYKGTSTFDDRQADLTQTMTVIILNLEQLLDGSLDSGLIMLIYKMGEKMSLPKH